MTSSLTRPRTKCYPTRDAAMASKLGRSGGFEPVRRDDGQYQLRKIAERKPAPRKAPRDTGPDRATRALVLERDGYACACCGRSVIGQRYSLQHRKRRSQGGDNSPANLLTVLGDGSQGCHARIDSRINPEDELRGYTVRSNQDPRLIGVMYCERDGSGVTRWLEEDGGVLYEPPAGAEAVA